MNISDARRAHEEGAVGTRIGGVQREDPGKAGSCLRRTLLNTLIVRVAARAACRLDPVDGISWLTI